jgi:hypothetical protein
MWKISDPACHTLSLSAETLLTAETSALLHSSVYTVLYHIPKASSDSSSAVLPDLYPHSSASIGSPRPHRPCPLTNTAALLIRIFHTPYGVYNVNKNIGFVNVGASHDTSEFAVESISRWWEAVGKQTYPAATKLYISCRVRIWKYQLHQFAGRTGITIHVSHFPPGASKWNKIEPGFRSCAASGSRSVSASHPATSPNPPASARRLLTAYHHPLTGPPDDPALHAYPQAFSGIRCSIPATGSRPAG